MVIQTLSGELYDKTEVESIKTELTEKIDTIIITGGGVSPTVFEETVTRLEETDSTINAAILTLQETDATINDRVAALETGGGSGGSTTDLTVVNERLTALEAEDDATIARVVALENKDLTLTDNITALQEADTSISARVTALEAGGGSGEVVSEKIFEFTGEYLLDSSTTDELDFTVNIDAIDSDKFKEAIDDNYKFQLCLRAPQTQIPIVIATYMYALQIPNYVFMFNLDSLGMASDELYGRVQIAVIQNEDTGNYELGQYHIDKGDDDSLNLVTLDKRVTALKETNTTEHNAIIEQLPVVIYISNNPTESEYYNWSEPVNSWSIDINTLAKLEGALANGTPIILRKKYGSAPYISVDDYTVSYAEYAEQGTTIEATQIRGDTVTTLTITGHYSHNSFSVNDFEISYYTLSPAE